MDEKYRVLKQYFGYSSFRDGQEALIDAQLKGRDAFGIMPTGGGKSLCYQIPALLSEGVTLVISPLISLMKDQVSALQKEGIASAYINSTLSPEQLEAVYENLAAKRYKIVYAAPERLAAGSFLRAIKKVHISIVAVDEAHCISQWGQDFRPSYLTIVDFLDKLGYRPVVSAFTATATPAVREDVERILALKDPLRVVTGFDRPNLRFEVLKPHSKPAAVLELIQNRQGKSGIVYCSTRKDTEKVCTMLQNRGILATRYHAGLSDEERQENQESFIHDRCDVIVATNAFGMGIDKSNVSYVIHYNMPKSMEAYYQEAGRAGRDGTEAECILLYGAGDVTTARYLIEHTTPKDGASEAQRKQVLEQDLWRLDQMVAYCKTGKCLRAYILAYFGESAEPSCHNCGNCSTPTTAQDITIPARMILSCVKRIQDRLGYPVGAALVMRVLCGSRDKRILALGLDELSTYGLMRPTPRAQVREWIELLETDGALQKSSEHGALTLTARAGDILFRGQKVIVQVRKPVTPAAKPHKPTPAADDGLFDALKLLRLRIAAKERIPAYLVFSNATLQDMAAKAPTTMDEFLSVSGVGKYKADRYAAEFLAEVRRHTQRR